MFFFVAILTTAIPVAHSPFGVVFFLSSVYFFSIVLIFIVIVVDFVETGSFRDFYGWFLRSKIARVDCIFYGNIREKEISTERARTTWGVCCHGALLLVLLLNKRKIKALPSVLYYGKIRLLEK